MKKIIQEFKKFIMRGNVVDMAVGVIVGSSFTAIVNGMSNNILKPIINWLLAIIFGANSLSEVYTMLKPVYVDGVIDLENSIYIDWGAFINAVINFFLVAIVLFSIVKVFNHLHESNKKFKKKVRQRILTKEDKRILKARGIKIHDFNAVDAYLDNKILEAEKKAQQEKLEAEEKARIEKENNPPTEELLKQILAVLKNEKPNCK